MFGIKHNTLNLSVLALSGLCFTGCFMAAEETLDNDPARVTVAVKIAASESAPARMVLELTSSKGDTLRDTISEKGNRLTAEPTFLNAFTTSEQTIEARYDLAPNRAWNVVAKVFDKRDSLKQADTGSVAQVKSFEERTVDLEIGQRFAAYSAAFGLPNGMTLAGVAGAEARQVYFTRLQVVVDGQIVRDSVSANITGGYLTAESARLPGSMGKRFFKPSAAGIILSHDYILPGARNITLNAYGYLEGDTVGVTAPRLLFQGGKTLNAVLGKASAVEAETVSLEWKAVNAGTVAADVDQAGLTVTLGKVGKITVVAQMSGAVTF